MLKKELSGERIDSISLSCPKCSEIISWRPTKKFLERGAPKYYNPTHAQKILDHSDIILAASFDADGANEYTPTDINDLARYLNLCQKCNGSKVMIAAIDNVHQVIPCQDCGARGRRQEDIFYLKVLKRGSSKTGGGFSEWLPFKRESPPNIDIRRDLTYKVSSQHLIPNIRQNILDHILTKLFEKFQQMPGISGIFNIQKLNQNNTILSSWDISSSCKRYEIPESNRAEAQMLILRYRDVIADEWNNALKSLVIGVNEIEKAAVSFNEVNNIVHGMLQSNYDNIGLFDAFQNYGEIQEFIEQNEAGDIIDVGSRVEIPNIQNKKQWIDRFLSTPELYLLCMFANIKDNAQYVTPDVTTIHDIIYVVKHIDPRQILNYKQSHSGLLDYDFTTIQNDTTRQWKDLNHTIIKRLSSTFTCECTKQSESRSKWERKDNLYVCIRCGRNIIAPDENQRNIIMNNIVSKYLGHEFNFDRASGRDKQRAITIIASLPDYEFSYDNLPDLSQYISNWNIMYNQLRRIVIKWSSKYGDLNHLVDDSNGAAGILSSFIEFLMNLTIGNLKNKSLDLSEYGEYKNVSTTNIQSFPRVTLDTGLICSKCNKILDRIEFFDSDQLSIYCNDCRKDMPAEFGTKVREVVITDFEPFNFSIEPPLYQIIAHKSLATYLNDYTSLEIYFHKFMDSYLDALLVNIEDNPYNMLDSSTNDKIIYINSLVFNKIRRDMWTNFIKHGRPLQEIDVERRFREEYKKFGIVMNLYDDDKMLREMATTIVKILNKLKDFKIHGKTVSLSDELLYVLQNTDDEVMNLMDPSTVSLLDCTPDLFDCPNCGVGTGNNEFVDSTYIRKALDIDENMIEEYINEYCEANGNTASFNKDVIVYLQKIFEVLSDIDISGFESISKLNDSFDDTADKFVICGECNHTFVANIAAFNEEVAEKFERENKKDIDKFNKPEWQSIGGIIGLDITNYNSDVVIEKIYQDWKTKDVDPIDYFIKILNNITVDIQIFAQLIASAFEINTDEDGNKFKLLGYINETDGTLIVDKISKVAIDNNFIGDDGVILLARCINLWLPPMIAHFMEKCTININHIVKYYNISKAQDVALLLLAISNDYNICDEENYDKALKLVIGKNYESFKLRHNLRKASIANDYENMFVLAYQLMIRTDKYAEKYMAIAKKMFDDSRSHLEDAFILFYNNYKLDDALRIVNIFEKCDDRKFFEEYADEIAEIKNTMVESKFLSGLDLYLERLHGDS